MSIFAAGPHLPVIVRANEAEYLPDIRHYLLADSSATNGALSAHRVQLGRSENGAVPHRHNNSSELFFMLDGTLDVLVGSEIVPASPGDLLIVPPQCDHAFRAHPDHTADALIIIAPGVERFDYFRHVARVRRAEATRESLLAEQDRYDTHFVTGPIW